MSIDSVQLRWRLLIIDIVGGAFTGFTRWQRRI